MKIRYFVGLLGLLTILVGCGGDSSDSKSNAVSIYNQAYQENYQADSIEDILSYAKNGYVLIDPFADDAYRYVSAIKKNNNQVGGYISIGTGEENREDFSELKPYLTDKVWDDWAGEFFVNETNSGIIDIMKKRIDKMATWGLDWVEFDNMDWFDDEDNKKKYNLKVTAKDAKEYVNTLCDYTHKKGMRCMAKNIVDGFEIFDGVLYESFSNRKNWWDTNGTNFFLDMGKLVIINHYNEVNCDSIYESYKNYYDSEDISFICEDAILKKYRHYLE